MPAPVLECVPNVSEGRDQGVIARLAETIRRAAPVRLADIHSDPDHHRSVLTFLGVPAAVERAALALAETVFTTIDMSLHHGVHPRLGALDVLPFVPLAGMSMGEVVSIAHRVGEALGRVHQVPVYFFAEAATTPARRPLPAVRAGQYEGLPARLGEPAWRPDAGPARFDARKGAVAVGARDVLVAFNVWLDTPDLDRARRVARAVRASSGGLPALLAIGVPLPSRGLTQVAMNLLDYRQTSLAAAWDAVSSEARRHGIAVRRGEVVGLVPRAALAGRPPETVGLADLGPEKYLDTHLARIIHEPAHGRRPGSPSGRGGQGSG